MMEPLVKALSLWAFPCERNMFWISISIIAAVFVALLYLAVTRNP